MKLPFNLLVFLVSCSLLPAKQPPNILLAVADDWGPNAGEWVKTPHFDRVTEQGLLFTRAYMSGEEIETRWVNQSDFEINPPPASNCAADKQRTVLALGDSITAGGKGYPTYRQFLASELAKEGLSFIGPRHDAYSAHAGFGGRSSSDLLKKIDELYREYPADFVLLHSGHNHFTKDQPVPQILKDTEAIVSTIHNINPAALILIAQAIPAGKLPKYSYIPELNRELGGLVARLKQAGLPVVLVDQAEGFDWPTDTLADKVHPNATGAQKMAKRWLTALEPMLGSR